MTLAINFYERVIRNLNEEINNLILYSEEINKNKISVIKLLRNIDYLPNEIIELIVNEYKKKVEQDYKHVLYKINYYISLRNDEHTRLQNFKKRYGN